MLGTRKKIVLFNNINYAIITNERALYKLNTIPQCPIKM